MLAPMIAATIAAAAVPVAPPPRCGQPEAVIPAASLAASPNASPDASVAANPGVAAPRRLDRLPPAAQFLTVYRTVDRCPAPVIVRAEIGDGRR